MRAKFPLWQSRAKIWTRTYYWKHSKIPRCCCLFNEWFAAWLRHNSSFNAWVQDNRSTDNSLFPSSRYRRIYTKWRYIILEQPISSTLYWVYFYFNKMDDNWKKMPHISFQEWFPNNTWNTSKINQTGKIFVVFDFGSKPRNKYTNEKKSIFICSSYGVEAISGFSRIIKFQIQYFLWIYTIVACWLIARICWLKIKNKYAKTFSNLAGIIHSYSIPFDYFWSIQMLFSLKRQHLDRTMPNKCTAFFLFRLVTQNPFFLHLNTWNWNMLALALHIMLLR